MKETFGQRFIRLRKNKGLTQDDIANKVNISPQAVSKWENDISLPDITVLPLLADIFNITIDELLGRQEVETKLLSDDEKKDVNKMMLKIIVNSSDGDKIRVNVPISLLKIVISSGAAFPAVNNGKGENVLNNIDFNEIMKLVEQGVVGKLVEVESSDGDIINILVE